MYRFTSAYRRQPNFGMDVWRCQVDDKLDHRVSQGIDDGECLEHIEFFGLALGTGQGSIGAGLQIQDFPPGCVFKIDVADVATAGWPFLQNLLS